MLFMLMPVWLLILVNTFTAETGLCSILPLRIFLHLWKLQNSCYCLAESMQAASLPEPQYSLDCLVVCLCSEMHFLRRKTI